MSPSRTPPWKSPHRTGDRKAPRNRLNEAQKEAAKRRAEAAGRRYPNLIDNMWAARTIPILLLIAMAPAAATTGIERVEASAYSGRNGALLYRETHWRYQEGGLQRREVLYRCPDGAPFARKRLWYTDSPSTPEFDFTDGRDGYREGLYGRGPSRRTYWRPQQEAPQQRREVVLPQGAVVDAGFDEYIRAHWGSLQSGQSVSASFVLPSRDQPLALRITPSSVPADESYLRLRLKFDAWYGFALPQTELLYRRSDRRLLRFEGIGTIRDLAGRYPALRIEFDPAPPVREASRRSLEAALSAPLTGRCIPS